MSKRAYRRLQGLMLLSTIVVLWAAFYLQFIGGLKPCPLCLMQRVCSFLFGMFCLMGLCLSTRSRGRSVAVLQMLFSFAGLFFALRQLWLQTLPASQVPACLPGLEVLIHYFPWHDVLFALFWGTGDCAEITWTMLGYSLPAWSTLYFLTMFFASGLVFFLLRQSMARMNQRR